MRIPQRMPKGKWLVCLKCSRKDITEPGHIGTKDVMKCKDCMNNSGFASMCRNCCPTGHGTKFGDVQEFTVELPDYEDYKNEN